MKCPDRKQLHDFLNHELDSTLERQITNHLQQCQHCRDAVVELTAIYKGVDKIASQEICPAEDKLQQYLAENLSDRETHKIHYHINRCPECSDHIAWLKMSLSQQREHEESLAMKFEEAYIEDKAVAITKEIVNRLLPNYVDLIDKLWHKIVPLVDRLLQEPEIQWPSLGPSTTVGIGFSGQVREESDIAIIAAAALIEIRRVSLNPGLSAAELSQSCNEDAKRLGANRVLAQKISKIMPDMIIED